jgi:acyl carrier protein
MLRCGARAGEQRVYMETKLEIEREIKSFLTTNFPLYDEKTVDPEASLVESGVIDSLGILELVEFVEARFRLQIPEDDLLPENLDSIANISRYLAEKLGADTVVRDEASGS